MRAFVLFIGTRDNMSTASKTTRRLFMFYSRPLFRTCEIISNHAARIFLKKSSLAKPGLRNKLGELDDRRKAFQGDLNRIGNSHGYVCAECKGKCCGGARERDAFLDRVLQDPDTSHLKARRKCGEMAAYKLLAAGNKPIAVAEDAERVDGFCPELTVQGCRIPYDLRPIQCTAYFCNKTVDALSQHECTTGIKALYGLMKIQLQAVLLAFRSSLSDKN